MRIGLLSDTHIRELTQELPPQLIEAFRGVELILHAGDIYVPEVLDKLEGIAPVLAAIGDDDYGAILVDGRVKASHALRCEGKTIWLVHESHQYHQLKSRRSGNPPKIADVPDIVVFGHTHYPILERHNGVLFVNPGSPLDAQNTLGTIAILSLDPHKPAEAQIVRLEADR